MTLSTHWRNRQRRNRWSELSSCHHHYDVEDAYQTHHGRVLHAHHCEEAHHMNPPLHALADQLNHPSKPAKLASLRNVALQPHWILRSDRAPRLSALQSSPTLLSLLVAALMICSAHMNKLPSEPVFHYGYPLSNMKSKPSKIMAPGGSFTTKTNPQRQTCWHTLGICDQT